MSKYKIDIESIANKWDSSGAFALYYEGERTQRSFFGLANRETGEKINENSTYLFSGSARFLISLSLLKLIDMKKIKLSDTLDKYIPEYTHANKIKIAHLLQGESGIRDYFYGKIMPELKNDEKHNKLDEKERLLKETKMSTKGYSFEEVFKLIGNEELEFEPGAEKWNYSTSEVVFCKEIIERVSEMKLLDFEYKYIFEPLNMSQTKRGRAVNTNTYSTYRNKELLKVEIDEAASDLFTTTVNDVEKLVITIYEDITLSSNKLLSAKTWKKAMTLNEENLGLGFSSVNGIICSDEFELLGNQAAIYFNIEAKLCFLHLSNAEQILENIDGTWTHFRKEMRNEIDVKFTYPRNTRIVPFNTKNWFDVLNLQISKEQYEFVCDAKQSIAYAFAYKKDHKLFAAMEGDKPVGLMVLQANKKTQDFYFSILLVDKRYQARGFGKIMLKWGVEYLKKQGAKELSINVNRFNVSAYHLYKSVGFKDDLVYPEGVRLKMEL